MCPCQLLLKQSLLQALSTAHSLDMACTCVCMLVAVVNGARLLTLPLPGL